jgi:hypothetical protein
MTSKKSWATVIFLSSLAACGGGGLGVGSGAISPPAMNADPEGIWQGTDTLTGDALEGVITGTGTARFIDLVDGTQYIGTAITTGNSISGSYSAYTVAGTTFADGSTTGSGTVTGTIAAGQTVNATFAFTTANGTASSEIIQFTFDTLYNTGSSFAAIAGNYTNPSTGATVSVNGAGSIFSQDPVTGCVINGTVSIIDPSFDVHDVSYSFASCTGSSAFLNGTTATGLGILDTAASPAEAIIGVSNTAAGYILTEELPLQ